MATYQVKVVMSGLLLSPPHAFGNVHLLVSTQNPANPQSDAVMTV